MSVFVTAPASLEDTERNGDAGAQHQPLVYLDQLTPPMGTMYYKRQNNIIFDRGLISETRSQFDLAYVTWRVGIHVYVSGVKPNDPKFSEKGGLITMILVHQGFTETPDRQIELNGIGEFLHTIKSPIPRSFAKQFPPSNSGVQSGINWQYMIDFQQTMPLFRNAGYEGFEFFAKYKEEFTLAGMKQMGAEFKDGVKFAVQLQKNTRMGFSFPIIGLSVLKYQDPKAFPITLECNAALAWRDIDEPFRETSTLKKSVEVNLDFQA